MKYIYRVPVLMCKDDRKKSYFGGFDYSFILDNKKEFINKTINIYALKKAGKYDLKVHKTFDNKSGEVDYSLEVKNGVKIGEFTILDIDFNIGSDMLLVKGLVDSEYHIGSGVFSNLGFKLGGMVSSKDGIKEMLDINFIYVFDIIREHKGFMYNGDKDASVLPGMENTTINYLEKKKRKHLKNNNYRGKG